MSVRKIMIYVALALLLISFNALPVSAYESKEHNFKINFPSEPIIIKAPLLVEDSVLDIVAYQSNDGVGLYSLSVGTLRKELIQKEAKRNFLDELFKGMTITQSVNKIYTKAILNEPHYHLTYLYTSTMHEIEWIHIGLIFFSSNTQYIKLTMVYPKKKLGIAEEKFDKFRDSFQLLRQ